MEERLPASPDGVEQHYDVAIVGYGPVGADCGTLLGRAGHQVAVIEKWPTFYPMPRAVHFDHEVARILQNVGLRPDESAAIEPYDAMYAWRNADRKDLMLVDWTGVGPTGWHTSNFFVQPLLEPELDRLARAQPTVSLQRGWEVVAIEEADEPAQTITLVVEGSDGLRRNGQRRDPQGGLRDRCRRRQQLRPRDHGRTHARPGILLRLADRRPRSARRPRLRPTGLAAVRPGAADHDRARRPGAAALGMDAAARRGRRRPQPPGTSLGAARDPGTCTRATRPSSGTPCTPSRPAGPRSGDAVA